MAISKGWDGGIWISTAAFGVSTGAEIAHINSWEIGFNNDALENTVFGDTVYDRTYQPGLRSHTITFSGYTEAANAGQDIMLDEQRSGTEASLLKIAVLTERVADARAGWWGEGVITGITIGTPVDGLSPMSGTLQVSGGLATFCTS